MNANLLKKLGARISAGPLKGGKNGETRPSVEDQNFCMPPMICTFSHRMIPGIPNSGHLV